jgi:hypothetical protein
MPTGNKLNKNQCEIKQIAAQKQSGIHHGNDLGFGMNL